MITKIEQALLSCNGDKFANICRLYLAYKFHIVNSSGFVAGKEKSRIGTPDNFIPYKDFYYFNEITTQEKGVIGKLKNDILHCFNQKDVPADKILGIILICNSKLSLAHQETLNKYKGTFNSETNLEVIGIDAFASIIYRDYPSILKELGIAIDTGQILETQDFVKQYEKSKFATPLSNQFFNRKEELKKGLDNLSVNDILLVFGDAGVGKTKLSLELAEQFLRINESYESKFIISNGNLCIWEDLKLQLNINKDYLIVVDDANKLKSNLDLILNFKNDREGKGRVKLILTVRSYVKEQVKGILENYSFIEINKFDKKELSNLLESPEFNISRYYIDRIYNISKGNPRIAIMAAIAGINNDIEKLHNASEIYKEYFSSVHKNISELNDEVLLITAGVISLYRTVDISDTETVEQIENLFKINKAQLTEKCKLLNKYEIVDEFGLIYKISDQILGEYIFYIVFIKDKKISFMRLLDIYYEKSYFPLIRVLTPIITNYGFDEVKTLIYPDIKTKWDKVKSINLNKSLSFLKDFWFYIPNETIAFINKEVDKIPNEPTNEYAFEIYRDNILESYDDKLIDVLTNFKQLPEKFNLVLEVLLKHGLKTVENFKKLLKIYCQTFVYGQYSMEMDYVIETKLFDFLYEKAKTQHDLFSKIILFIAPTFLVSSYRTNSSDGLTIYLHTLPIHLSPKHKSFRKKLWVYIFKSFTNDGLKENFYDFIFEYINKQDYHSKNDLVLGFDKKLILDFFIKNFSPSVYKECYIVHYYLDRLDLFKIDYDKEIRKKFTNDLYNVFLVLNQDKLKRREFKGDYEKYDEFKYKELDNFTKKYDLKDYKKLFDDTQFVISEDLKSNRHNGAESSISQILICLYRRNPELLIQVLKLLFEYEFSRTIQIGYLFRAIKDDILFIKQIRSLLFNDKIGNTYLSLFWNNLESENFEEIDLEMMYQYLNGENYQFTFTDEFFKKNHKIEDKAKEIDKVLDIILEKEFPVRGGYYLKGFFIYVAQEFESLFDKRINDIENLYLKLDEGDSHFDYHLELLKVILAKDGKFILKVLQSNFDDKTYISKRDLMDNDFSKLWELENHKEIFIDIFKYLSKFPKVFHNTACDVSSVFVGNSQKEIDFLLGLIEKNPDERELTIIYNIIVTKYNDRKLEYLGMIIDANPEIDFFKRLEMYVNGSTYSGSRIPRIKNSISELEKVKTFIESLNDIRFIEHIAYLEERIMYKKNDIERERRREFLDELGI